MLQLLVQYPTPARLQTSLWISKVPRSQCPAWRSEVGDDLDVVLYRKLWQVSWSRFVRSLVNLRTRRILMVETTIWKKKTTHTCKSNHDTKWFLVETPTHQNEYQKLKCFLAHPRTSAETYGHSKGCATRKSQYHRQLLARASLQAKSEGNASTTSHYITHVCWSTLTHMQNWSRPENSAKMIQTNQAEIEKIWKKLPGPLTSETKHNISQLYETIHGDWAKRLANFRTASSDNQQLGVHKDTGVLKPTKHDRVP